MQKNRAIASARAAIGDHFELIVGIAGIQPKEGWKLWEDTEGNRLRISKNKHVQVYPAKTSIDVTNDIFRKARPEEIAKHSYWVLCIFGKDKSLLNFLGNDGNLRSCYFENGEWQYNTSPVLLGYQPLRHVALGYIETEARKVQAIKLSYITDFKIEEAWASGYPTDNKDLQEKIHWHLTKSS